MDNLFQSTFQVIQVVECSILLLIYFILAYNKYFWGKDGIFHVWCSVLHDGQLQTPWEECKNNTEA